MASSGSRDFELDVAEYVEEAFERCGLEVRTGYDLLEFSIKNKKNFLKKILYYFLTGFCILYSDLYTVTSKSDNDLLRRRLFAKNIEIRPNWIKIEKEVKTVNKKHNTILSVGRLEHQKNYKSVISSISNSKYIYDIFGQGSLKKNLVKFANIEKSEEEGEGILQDAKKFVLETMPKKVDNENEEDSVL